MDRLKKSGALNAYLGIDTNVFVDPSLLRSTKIPEFRDAKDDFTDYFSPIIKLLKATKRIGDIAWGTAITKLRFREEHGAALGYSAAGGSGRGIGEALAELIVQRGKEIVDLGIDDSEIFEVIGLFQEGFGPDLLSDMAVAILKPRFFAYTQRVAADLKLAPTKTFRLKGREWTLPVHPDRKTALILVPSEVLTPLPIALDRSEIAEVAQFNAEVRAAWNAIVAAAGKEKREPTKAEIRKMLLARPENLADLIAVYKKAARKGYDFARDPLGLFSWDYYGRTAAERFPLKIAQAKPRATAEMMNVLNLIVAQFKKNIEDNKLYEVLYGENGEPRPEVFGQRLFYAIADSYCAANDVDLSREPNPGNGPVDFKLSVGYRGRVLVEIKKSTNPRLLHGFDTQLSAYQKAEATEQSLYLILRVSEGKRGIKDVLALREEKLKKKLRVPDVVVIDARKKPSASKLLKLRNQNDI
ncbi:MAG TPA: hypothetical protein VN982_00445 [Candidatus Dormibacteraeota bacterium]|nr:hypothetical protein [Candidatus Dormibacteraeota bacterium]